MQFKKKIYSAIYCNFQHTFVPYYIIAHVSLNVYTLLYRGRYMYTTIIRRHSYTWLRIEPRQSTSDLVHRRVHC